jgi:prolyl-tRNA synthetase
VCGARDVGEGKVVVATRFTKTKAPCGRDELAESIVARLDEVQRGMFEKARAFRDENTKRIDSKDEFVAFFTPKNAEKPEIHGGFTRSHWCGRAECEMQVKDTLAVTVRCIELTAPAEKGACVHCGQPSERRVIWAKSY